MIYGDSLFAAGVVSAGAAVELIRGLGLAHAVKNLGYLCLRRGLKSALDDGEVLLKLVAVRLVNFKILVAGELRHSHVVFYGRAVEFFHYRTAYAAAGAGGHLDKAVMYLAVFNVLECRHAVFNAVNRHVGVFRVVLRHGFEYAAGRREEARAAVIVRVRLTGKLNARRLEPACQLVECQNGVNYAFVVLRLVFFRNAGTDENSLAFGYLRFISLQ